MYCAMCRGHVLWLFRFLLSRTRNRSLSVVVEVMEVVVVASPRSGWVGDERLWNVLRHLGSMWTRWQAQDLARREQRKSVSAPARP